MAENARRGQLRRSDKAALKMLLTTGRLEPYRRAAPRKSDEGALLLYLWNADLSGALYTDIAFIEVILRNAVDQALRRLYGRDHWLLGPGIQRLRRRPQRPFRQRTTYRTSMARQEQTHQLEFAI